MSNEDRDIQRKLKVYDKHTQAKARLSRGRAWRRLWHEGRREALWPTHPPMERCSVLAQYAW